MSERRFFGTDGIRGRVGESPITADFMLRLGAAIGRALAREGARTVLIGKDTRISGYMFESALQAGLTASGIDVQLLGPMPTPAIAHLTRTFDGGAGIVISASHNPYYDNGIKIFSSRGEKLSDSVEIAIEQELEQPFATVDASRLGRVRRVPDVEGRYIEFCKSTARGLSLAGVNLVVDCAHGATYHIAPGIFAELGARVHAIGVEPDGLNINSGCGATDLALLQQTVLEREADLGIAFDGDGDRVMMVDRSGQVQDGDALLYVIAAHWARSGKLTGPVVGTLMSNFGLERAVVALGHPFLRARVGDRYVHKLMKEQHAWLGGESSGHILCLNKTTTGDGIVSALQVLKALQDGDCGLHDAVAAMRRLPQRTVNIPVASGARPLERESVREVLRDVESTLADRGRVILRASGTEPLVRVTIEAEDAQEVDRLSERLADAVRAAA